jgi:hypothetical protein
MDVRSIVHVAPCLTLIGDVEKDKGSNPSAVIASEAIQPSPRFSGIGVANRPRCRIPCLMWRHLALALDCFASLAMTGMDRVG